MKRNFYTLLVLVGALVITGISATGAKAQGYGDRNRASSGGGTYTITGKVLLPDGRPAPGVKVSANSEFTNTSATTDNDGVFSFGGIPAGNYNISAKTEGFAQENEMFTISRDSSSGQTFQLNLYLRNPGQKKGDIYSANPMFKDVSKAAIEKFQKAAEKIAKDDAKGAIPLLDEAIALYPQFAVAYYEKGAAHLKLNETDKAMAAFVKAIEIKPDYVEAKYSLGYTHFTMKNYEFASAIFVDVIQQKKDMPEAFMNLGISLVYLKKVDQAEYALKQAIGLKGGEKLALAHRYLGGIYIQKKKNAEAIAELQKYLDLVPKAPDADKLKQTINELKKQG
jgi:tetratricopeptide (TPR) repeat protein